MSGMPRNPRPIPGAFTKPPTGAKVLQLLSGWPTCKRCRQPVYWREMWDHRIFCGKYAPRRERWRG